MFQKQLEKGIKVKHSENIQENIELKDTTYISLVNGRSYNISGTVKIIKLKKFRKSSMFQKLLENGIKVKHSENVQENVELKDTMCISLAYWA